ncbi:unnamed protein product [Prunus armeniaca]|uniref:Uncharacterized protein n=1 Tax=Prunus armeniaca TaxID=36596 RepID=A0A6J5VZ21_PRUAR|nr:unnamed protein product [Prunus armeniaca]CAB4292755.1 unnamed protein product [Prunus armeniaca]CAB4293087.1 unnamed protein product [Prunus armeniaca]
MKLSIAREVRRRSSSWVTWLFGSSLKLFVSFIALCEPLDVDCKLHQLARKLQLGQGAPSFFGT